jgi:hypothetical protein
VTGSGSSAPIVPRLETALLSVMGLGILLVLQWWSFPLYQIGLMVLVLATLLNIAVGNLPRDASAMRSLVLIAGILLLVAAVFGIGIVLVPVLAELGQSAS